VIKWRGASEVDSSPGFARLGALEEARLCWGGEIKSRSTSQRWGSTSQRWGSTTQLGGGDQDAVYHPTWGRTAMAHGVLLEHGVAALAYGVAPSRTLQTELAEGRRPVYLICLPLSNTGREERVRTLTPSPSPLSERRAQHGDWSVGFARPSSAAFRPMAILRPWIESWRPGLQFPRLKTPLRPREGPRDRDLRP